MSYGVDGVHVDFGDVHALRGVDLDVPAGSVVAVVGGDGAGKTTLLRCLVGRTAPTAGSVRRPDRHEVGYMPATSGAWRDLTVDENVDFVAGAYAMGRAERARRRDELLARAGLVEASDRLARDLSGGMRQKLGFVLAVLHRPALLVLDEPSTGVDPVSRVELWRLIAETASAGTAVAMSTTYLDEAERASAIVVLDAGRVLAAGTRDEVMETFPGVITAPARPEDPANAWRRGRAVREWHAGVADLPSGSGPPLEVGALELEDVVIARLLDERAGSAPGGAPDVA